MMETTPPEKRMAAYCQTEGAVLNPDPNLCLNPTHHRTRIKLKETFSPWGNRTRGLVLVKVLKLLSSFVFRKRTILLIGTFIMVLNINFSCVIATSPITIATNSPHSASSSYYSNSSISTANHEITISTEHLNTQVTQFSANEQGLRLVLSSSDVNINNNNNKQSSSKHFDKTKSQTNSEKSENWRPLQHFSGDDNKDKQNESKGKGNHLEMADDPSTLPQSKSQKESDRRIDNNSHHQGETLDKKINKSFKPSKSPQAIIVSILEFTLPNSNSSSSSRIINANNKVNGTTNKQPHPQPRRLESLSHGLKNTRNSISFIEAEEDAEEVSNSNYASNSNPTTGFTNPSQSLSTGKSRKVNPLVNGPQNDENYQHVSLRKSSLQIRRDLSRLVANVAAGVDDDFSLTNKCDRVFISTPNGPKNGTFESPTLPMEEGNLHTCMLMFVPRPNERVEIAFRGFNVRGTPPECVHEWVDIWTEVEGTDPTDLITTPFSGRYCDRIPPRNRISLYGGIAIGFYSDKNSTEEPVFHGSFAFINESRFIVGTPVPRTLCSYTILSSSNKGVGELLSPTYPGVYPKNLSCSYKFVGTPGQRIRIEFRDFDVFYGGPHCPFDDVKIYDGPDPTSPLIGTYCGQQRNLVVYSSEHMMLVTFTTLDRNTNSQNRGFNAVYEFSNSFVKLGKSKITPDCNIPNPMQSDFIEKNMGDHIRGTECDQRILSKGQSSGVVYSPNYPFPYLPKIVCRYFVYGLQDPQHLERVRLSFEIFDVPSNFNSAEDEVNQSDAKRCGDGFLKVYLKGQEVIQAYDKADYEFCGKDIPHSVVSDGPRMVLVFSSGGTQGSGFKGKYSFETEYRIPGTEDPTIPCRFTYYSTSRLRGEFNSPRFPSNYPSSTNCSYLFYMENPKEQVRIVFDNFKLRADKFNYTDRGAYGSSCEEDWLEVWNVIENADDRLVGRYCGTTAPGPTESREQASALKVIMHTDGEGVYSGFKARYMFFTPNNPFGEGCGGNMSQAISGDITSPKWPAKYDGPTTKGDGSKTCNWYLTVRPGNRVMLHFQQFAIEGEPYGRGCPAAAVRIWEDLDGIPVELCGEVLLAENSQYVSTRNIMRVTFITADKAVGAPGFRAVWTEVQDGTNSNCHSSFFRCAKSQFCIPMDLKCDGVKNCGIFNGEPDNSDEEDSACISGGLDIGDMNLMMTVGGCVAGAFIVIILVCAWGQRRKRRRRRRLQLRRPPIHVCDNAGARFAAMDSV